MTSVITAFTMGCWDEGHGDESEDNIPSSMSTLIV